MKKFKYILIILAFISVYFLRVAVAENIKEVSHAVTFI